MNKSRILMMVGTLILISVLLAACLTPQDIAESQAQQNNENTQFYIPANGIEARNYNWRMALSDDPTTILWCTSAFSTPGSPMFTVPIIGKLTSGAKRPFPQYDLNGYEQAGADGMFGSSGEYRYGFGSTGQYEYYDFYGIETFCTTMPTVWQREATVIVYQKDPLLMDATNRARAALQAGNPQEADAILLQAIQQIQGGQ